MTTLVEVLERHLLADPDPVIQIYIDGTALPTLIPNPMPWETHTIRMPGTGVVAYGGHRVAVSSGDTLEVTIDKRLLVNGKAVP